MKKIFKPLILTFIIMILFSFNVYAVEDHVVDNDQHVPIPETYTFKKVLINLDGAGSLKSPEDLFLDSKGYLYVADAGNNRILKMDKNGKVLDIIKGPKDKPFNNPSGVFVDNTGNIYVADTENKRVIRLSTQGVYDKVYSNIKSNVLGDNFIFNPRKLYFSSTGMLYVLKGSSFMAIDDQNNFKGYVGANEVGFSLQNFLIRIFATRSQRDRVLKTTPVTYSNFVIGNDGLIYATVSNSTKGQIRKLNSIGKNLYPDLSFGEITMDHDGKPVLPSLGDIAVDNDGIISVIEDNSGIIYQYDQDGNMLCAFGDKGNRKERFSIPSSIVVDDDGVLYISDSLSNNIQILQPTHFTQLVHKAVSLYNNGNYKDAMKYWQEVLKIDANYSLAHKGIGKLYLKDGNYKESMREYKLAQDKDGYSQAFQEYRHQIFRTYFLEVFFVVIAIVVLCYFSIIWFSKKATKVEKKLMSGKESL